MTAQHEARALGHDYIGTEHLLLGLVREERGLAARALDELGVTLETVRADIARIVGGADARTTGQIPLTPRAKSVLELSAREALKLGHNYVGTEHVLLALASEIQGLAAQILSDSGPRPDEIRDHVIRLLGRTPSGTPEPGLAPEEQERLDEVRRLEAEALAANDLRRAAHFRRRDRELLAAQRPPRPLPVPGASSTRLVARRTSDRLQVAAAGLSALFGLAVGVLLGRAIWG